MKPVVKLLADQVATDLRALPGKVAGYQSYDARAQRCLDVADLRRAAKRAVPKPIFDYVDGAANDEVTARANCDDFDRLRILPRALIDVSSIDMSTTVLGQPVSLPLLGAPTGLTGAINHAGEPAVARALHAAGSLYILSAMATYTIEEVDELAPVRSGSSSTPGAIAAWSGRSWSAPRQRATARWWSRSTCRWPPGGCVTRVMASACLRA